MRQGTAGGQVRRAGQSLLHLQVQRCGWRASWRPPGRPTKPWAISSGRFGPLAPELWAAEEGLSEPEALPQAQERGPVEDPHRQSWDGGGSTRPSGRQSSRGTRRRTGLQGRRGGCRLRRPAILVAGAALLSALVAVCLDT